MCKALYYCPPAHTHCSSSPVIAVDWLEIRLFTKTVTSTHTLAALITDIANLICCH